ncbi:hypothetical protein TNCV_5122241 [Trichonephila clavipes]|nr:hypothetical protein TNCV_5122241 [Trichonephila clavipes]
MAYLGKGRSEVLFVLATELNLEFDKSMTIATLKDLIIGSENYDEELTKNIHSTIVEDRKAREKKQEEQKDKLHIEEREEKLRILQLKLDEQKRKDEFELEKLRIQKQSKLFADTSKERDTKFVVKEVSKFIHRFDLKEDISLYLKLFERQAQYEAPGKFDYNRKDKKFPAPTNYNKHYEVPVTKYESVQRHQDSAQKGYYNKNYEKHSNHNASKHIYAQTNYSKSQKFKEPPKEISTLIVKEGLRTKEILFGKVKIMALIDSGSTLMQISAENLQELDLRHVENRQIKKELEKLIQDYKPEKTASTDVTMRIILKDE